MGMVEVAVGDLDVLQSGSVIGGYDEPIEFVLDDNDGALMVRFLFRDDDNKGEGLVVEPKKAGSDREFIRTLVNFNNPLGIACKRTLEVGTFDGRVLYFKYYIFGTKGADKLMHYTWLLGEEI